MNPQRDDLRSYALWVDQHVKVSAVQGHDRPSFGFGSALFLRVGATEGELCGWSLVPSGFDLELSE